MNFRKLMVLERLVVALTIYLFAVPFAIATVIQQSSGDPWEWVYRDLLLMKPHEMMLDFNTWRYHLPVYGLLGVAFVIRFNVLLLAGIVGALIGSALWEFLRPSRLSFWTAFLLHYALILFYVKEFADVMATYVCTLVR